MLLTIYPGGPRVLAYPSRDPARTAPRGTVATYGSIAATPPCAIPDPYMIPFVALAPEVRGYRMRTDTLTHTAYVTQLLVLDVDVPHAPHEAAPAPTQAWYEQQFAALGSFARAHGSDPVAWYLTAGGLRVLFALDAPFVISDEATRLQWFAYATRMVATANQHGLCADHKCRDFTHIYRAPCSERYAGMLKWARPATADTPAAPGLPGPTPDDATVGAAWRATPAAAPAPAYDAPANDPATAQAWAALRTMWSQTRAGRHNEAIMALAGVMYQWGFLDAGLTAQRIIELYTEHEHGWASQVAAVVHATYAKAATGATTTGIGTLIDVLRTWHPHVPADVPGAVLEACFALLRPDLVARRAELDAAFRPPDPPPEPPTPPPGVPAPPPVPSLPPVAPPVATLPPPAPGPWAPAAVIDPSVPVQLIETGWGPVADAFVARHPHVRCIQDTWYYYDPQTGWGPWAGWEWAIRQFINRVVQTGADGKLRRLADSRATVADFVSALTARYARDYRPADYDENMLYRRVLVRLPDALRAAHPTAPPVVGALLHVQSGVLEPMRPDVWTTMAPMPWASGADAATPVWDRFLETLELDADTRAALQESLGHVLFSDGLHHNMHCLVGPRRAGKSVICEMLTRLVGGSDAVHSTTLGALATPFGGAPCVGKALVLMPDERDGGSRGTYTDARAAVGFLLRVSARDEVSFDRKFKAPWRGKLPARVWMATNNVPDLPDPSGALAARLQIIQLHRSFFGVEDRTLPARLAAEDAGLVQWAWAGWCRVRDLGWTRPASSNEAVDLMRDSSGPMAYLEEHYERVADADVSVPKQQIYDAFRLWCDTQGVDRPPTMHQFTKDLKAAGFRTDYRPRPTGELIPGAPERPRSIPGLRLRVRAPLAAVPPLPTLTGENGRLVALKAPTPFMVA